MPHNINKTIGRKGFTLIETFGAITILVLAVLGPLSLLTANIADGAIIKNQMTANYLAQEGIELIIRERNKQINDENADYTEWLGNFEYCKNGFSCNPDSTTFNFLKFNKDNCEDLDDDSCRMFADTASITMDGKSVDQITRFFNNDYTSQEPTIFKREVYYEEVTEGDIYDEVSIDPPVLALPTFKYFTGQEMVKITSRVTWNFKNKEKSYTLSTYLYNMKVDQPREVP